ncbi:MAG: hypothetical protein BHV68_22050 [Bacteroidales bacterium 43_8]|nr:MAG: hypothetical protein BHV68_22050 [Bacteroidales bacterium 43_8]
MLKCQQIVDIHKKGMQFMKNTDIERMKKEFYNKQEEGPRVNQPKRTPPPPKEEKEERKERPRPRPQPKPQKRRRCKKKHPIRNLLILILILIILLIVFVYQEVNNNINQYNLDSSKMEVNDVILSNLRKETKGYLTLAFFGVDSRIDKLDTGTRTDSIILLNINTKTGETKKYLVPLSKQILVQENDYVRAGTPLSDGAVTPSDILAIKGPTAVQEYIVNEVQDVYRMQGVKINDKHFEVIVRQMMRKVQILDPGDTRFLEQQIVDKRDFMDENDRIWGKKVVTDPGDSQTLKAGQIVTARKLRDENSALKRKDLKLIQVRDAIPATSEQILQGITRAALQTSSFMSAASFQETTKVLNEAAINGKVDTLEGMKENVICGHLIPAGTGQREFDKLIVGSKEEFDRVFANRKNVTDFSN